MAESTTPTTPPATTTTTTTPKVTDTPKQYIRASTDDNALEPDALRGSAQVIKDAGVVDDEEARREIYKKDEK